MKYVLFKLLPPRPTFVMDMTEAERALMGEHVAYWNGLMDQGPVRAFAMGLALEPREPFGIGIFTLDDDADPAALAASDPTIRSGTGFRYEILPMARAITRA